MDTNEPARSGLAAEIIARNAIEGSSTSETPRLVGWVPARALDLCVDDVQQLEARITELERREALPVIVVMDRNPDFSAELSVYIDGKRVDAKVMTYHSEQDPGDILGAHIRVYRNEYGTPEDWELELPDAWKADEWAAIVASEETYLPHVTLASEPGGSLPVGEGGVL